MYSPEIEDARKALTALCDAAEKAEKAFGKIGQPVSISLNRLGSVAMPRGVAANHHYIAKMLYASMHGDNEKPLFG